MKLTLLHTGLAALILFSVGCEKPAGREVSTAAEAAQPETAADAASSGMLTSDSEPIRNTSPEGSTMDPSSNAIIVFDGSGSMAGAPIGQAKSAVTAFVNGAPEDLNIGLVVFDRQRLDGSQVVPLGRGPQQRAQLISQIERIEAGGGTPLGSAIQIGANSLIRQFQKQLRYGDIRLIVVTDGIAGDPSTFEKSIRFASKYHVPIYTIGFRIRSNHPLRQFSEAYFTADDEKELLGAMQETLAELDDSVTIDL